MFTPFLWLINLQFLTYVGQYGFFFKVSGNKEICSNSSVHKKCYDSQDKTE